MDDETKQIEYVKVPLTDADLIEPPIKTITELILEAQQEALREGITANTVMINENMARVDAFDFQAFNGVYSIPPMICGMNLYFTKNELPDNYSFAVFEGPPNRLAEFESIGMEPSELRKAAELYRKLKELI